jgi:hypothetical protein
MDKNTNLSKQRKIGLILGAAMGFLYSLISTYINYAFIRDIPLFNDVSANLTQIVFYTLAGALMGFVVNWPEVGFFGIAAASLLGSIIIFIGALIKSLQVQGSYGLLLVAFFYFTLPLAALFVPLTALLRWAAGDIQQHPRRRFWTWHSLRVYLGLLLLTVIVGSFAMYSSEAWSNLRLMNEKIIQVQSSDLKDLPQPFKEISAVVANASRDYSLEWTDDLERFPYSLNGEEDSVGLSLRAVFAYFSSGESVACLFSSETSFYFCARVR